MTEFQNRVEAQRKLIKALNERSQAAEPLAALTPPAIDRWIVRNQVNMQSRVAVLLREASTQLFALANHSDDPICGTYRLSSEDLHRITSEIAAGV